MTSRIAIIQHGDYGAAARLIDAGSPETYAGMAHSMGVFRRLMAGFASMVISLDAPAGDTMDGEILAASEPLPDMPNKLPRRVPQWIRAHRVANRLVDFKPTHVVLRTTGPAALPVLKYCHKNDVNVLAIFASYFDPKTNQERRTTRQIVQLLNEDNVTVVANHREAATRSMIFRGVRADKTMAYDVVPQQKREPGVVRPLDPARPFNVAYVGLTIRSKGVFDLVDAVIQLRASGVDIRLTMAGDGGDLAQLRESAQSLGDACTLLGKVPHAQAMQVMTDADVVCVPSHHSYAEGQPLTLTESLLNRRPVVVSDHPVMKTAFVDDEGLRFFPAGDAVALAQTLRSILTDPAIYQRLAESTLAAYARVECKTTFDDVIFRWHLAAKPAKPAEPAAELSEALLAT